MAATPFFFPHDLSSDGTPSAEAVRRAFPKENDKRTDEELLSAGRFLIRFIPTFTAIAAIKHEEAFQAKVKKRLANHEKYLRRKAKLKEGMK